MQQNYAELNSGENVAENLILANDVRHRGRVRLRRLPSQLRENLLAKQYVLRDLQLLLPVRNWLLRLLLLQLLSRELLLLSLLLFHHVGR